MKILFIIQGEGRGHLTQALSLRQKLADEGHEIVGVLVGKSPARIVSKNIKAGKTSDSIEYRLTGAIHQAEMPLDAGSYSTTVPVAEGYGSWAEAAGRYPQDAARLLWSRDAWLADVPALRGRAGCSGGMIGPIEKVSPPGETGWRVSAYGVASGAAQCIQPKEVSPSGGRAALSASRF